MIQWIWRGLARVLNFVRLNCLGRAQTLAAPSLILPDLTYWGSTEILLCLLDLKAKQWKILKHLRRDFQVWARTRREELLGLGIWQKLKLKEKFKSVVAFKKQTRNGRAEWKGELDYNANPASLLPGGNKNEWKMLSLLVCLRLICFNLSVITAVSGKAVRPVVLFWDERGRSGRCTFLCSEDHRKAARNEKNKCFLCMRRELTVKHERPRDDTRRAGCRFYKKPLSWLSTEEHGRAGRGMKKTARTYLAFSLNRNNVNKSRQDVYLITAAVSELLYNLQATKTFFSAPPEPKTEISSVYCQRRATHKQCEPPPIPAHQDLANHIITFSGERNWAWNFFTVTIHPAFSRQFN